MRNKSELVKVPRKGWTSKHKPKSEIFGKERTGTDGSTNWNPLLAPVPYPSLFDTAGSSGQLERDACSSGFHRI